VIYNRTSNLTLELAQEHPGFIPVFSLEDLVRNLEAPRAVWTMVPAGGPTEEMLLVTADLLSEGDILVDGGNANFHDSMRRGKRFAERNIHFLDVGVSGGIWGLKEGYSLMIGGEAEAVESLTPIFQTLAPAPNQGWGHVGSSGAGHYVKMVHNGIEYGMMEALAEGFDLLQSRNDYQFDTHQIAEIWRTGSVVRSWLLDLSAAALADNPTLEGIKPWVADSGEGRWTVKEAIDQGVPAPVIATALFRRFESQDENSYANRLLAAMRNQFGGHEIKQ
ncbi:MAG: decarboxylating 6-phosphogluconate dehydrogenase, partial [Anaerolineaceae bacterium]|nr:decarboxylating 6-phosphogluconate dehydrogenase [Anaerolineaceae bacterium]